jgi:DNA polymerase-3 subunit beta
MNGSAIKRDLGLMAKVVNTKSPLSIIQNVKLTPAQSEEDVAITATNLEFTVQVGNHGDNAVCVNYAILKSIFDTLDDDDVRFELDGNVLGITSGTSHFDLKTVPASEFPQTPEPDTYAKSGLVKGISSAFQRVRHAAGEKNSMLDCVYFDKNYMVATNRFRVARTSFSATVPFLLPIKTADLVAAVFGDDEVYVTGENLIRFEDGRLTVWAAPLTYHFPDYNRIYASVEGYRKFAAVDKNVRLSAVRCALIGTEVTIECRDGILSMRAVGDEGSVYDNIPVDAEGEFRFTVNAQYLLDAINSATQKDASIRICAEEAKRPILITNDAGYDEVIMPIVLPEQQQKGETENVN